MTRAMWVVVVLGALAGTAAADPESPSAFEPRTMDLGTGVVLSQALRKGDSVALGQELDARFFPTRALWFGVGAAYLVTDGGPDPETEAAGLIGSVGISAGVHGNFASNLEGIAGLQVDYLRTTALPTDSRDQSGIDVGPQLALALEVGTAWGHPISFEARASYLLSSYEHGPQTFATWAGGLYFRGVLTPDRPLR